MSSPEARAILRFVRTAVGIGMAAAIGWGINNASSIPTPLIAAIAAPVLVALDKYCRDKGWY